MTDSFFKRIFGKRDEPGPTKAAASEQYNGFEVHAAPVKEANGWRVTGSIAKEIEGVRKQHDFVRADCCGDLESAASLTLRKARQLIDEQGERIFD